MRERLTVRQLCEPSARWRISIGAFAAPGKLPRRVSPSPIATLRVELSIRACLSVSASAVAPVNAARGSSAAAATRFRRKRKRRMNFSSFRCLRG